MTKKYLIKRLNCICNECLTRYVIDLPADISIVKIVSETDDSIYWLPLAGDNGYIDLMDKLTNVRKNNNIDMKRVREFEKALNNLLSTNGIEKQLIVDRGERNCPTCNSKNVKVISEEFVDDYDFHWLEFDDTSL